MHPNRWLAFLPSVLCLVLFGGVRAATAQAPPRAFLEDELPLKILLTTPTDIIKAPAKANTVLDGRQAITAVFSRPVIALGSDFGLKPTNQSLLPFTLSCPVPGKFRWVTTSIARFDPDVDWPTDLNCTFYWVTGLTTFDGVTLTLGDFPTFRRLTSKSLTMHIDGVMSYIATNLTDGLWDGTLGLPSDVLPEVPPDGRLLLSFNYPVNLGMLRKELLVYESRRAGEVSGRVLDADVAPCQSPATFHPATSLSESLKWEGSPSTTSSPTTAVSNNVSHINASCVAVRPLGSLRANTSYTLRLNHGSRYHALAGPLGTNLSITFGGLRPFRVPWVEGAAAPPWVAWQSQDLRYRRLDLWLPHGLSSDTLPEALAARISLCQNLNSNNNNSNNGNQNGDDNGICAPGVGTSLPFNLSMVSRGIARLSVPSLEPGMSYKAVVLPDTDVQDGFNLSLQASSTEFNMSYVPYTLAAPVTGSGLSSGSLFLLEAGAETLSAWPYAVHPPPPPGTSPYESYITVYDSVAAWAPDVSTDKGMAKVLSLMVGWRPAVDLYDLLGPPAVEVPLELNSSVGGKSTGGGWREVLLPLPAGLGGGGSGGGSGSGSGSGSTGPPARIYVVHACCDPPSFGVGKRSGQVQVLLNSSLSVSALQSGATLLVWVLDVALGGGPVANAVVTVFINQENDNPPSVFDRCTTNAEGLCNVTMAWEQYAWRDATVVVTAGDQVAMLPRAGWVRKVAGPSLDSDVVATLVADRLVVVPGDSVKITGFVQRVERSNLSLVLPPESFAVLRADPPWVGVDSTERTEDANVLLVNGTTGTVHGEVTVPKNARLQSYMVQLAIQQPPSGGSPNLSSSTASMTARLDSDKWPVVGQLQITVADPRPPTADLKLSAPAWSFPNSSVTLTATAMSYIGASVAGAPLTVTWRTAKASGTLNLIADQNGLGEGNIDLGALPTANRSEPYDTLAIDMEWIGPTRERITRSASVTLADGPARLNLQLSLTPSVPSTAFAVAATLTSNTDGTALSGVPVTVTLRPALPGPDDSPEGCGNNLTSGCDEIPGGSGSPFSPRCQLVLPCIGKFVLEACADVAVDEEAVLLPAAAATANLPPAWMGVRGGGDRSGGGGSNNSGSNRSMTSRRVCTNQTLGRTFSDWAANPWSSHDQPLLSSDRSSYALGDSPVLLLQSPWLYSKVLVVWGNEATTKSKVVTTLPPGGLAEIPIGPLGRECRGGCSVTAVLDVPRLRLDDFGAQGYDVLRQLPTSRRFDPLAPHSHVMSLPLNVQPDNALSIAVEVNASTPGNEELAVHDVGGELLPALEPGSNATITVAVTRGAVREGVEVTVYGVDKAFLDLLPYDLPHPEQEMVLRLAADISTATVNDYRIAPDAVRAVYDKLMMRLTQLDPWLPADSYVGQGPSYIFEGPSAVDMNDTAYLNRFASAATLMPQNVGGYPQRRLPAVFGIPNGVAGAVATALAIGETTPVKKDAAFTASIAAAQLPAPAPAMADAAATIAASPTLSQPRATSAFIVTPLFTKAMTGSNGKVSLEFTAPPNLGTFVIRAYAAAGSSACYGSGEAKVAVRRRVSLTPSLPRFARVGDTFQAGVLVTVGSAPATVNVALQLGGGGALSTTGPIKRTVTLTSGGGLQQEVRFTFSAASVGSSNLTFTAWDNELWGGGVEDALMAELQVLGQQADVWVATSFALTGANTTTGSSNSSSSSGSNSSSVVQWQEGMVLPAAVPGSGSLSLTVGVGYFPAIAAMYNKLQQTDADRTYPAATPALLWATLPAVLSYYRRKETESQAADITRGLQDLKTLTDPRLGLLWAPPDRWGEWTPTRTDIYLNTWAVFLSVQHSLTTSRTTSSSLPTSPASDVSRWGSLEQPPVPIWKAAISMQLLDDAEAARKLPEPRPYGDYNTLAWAWLALGAEWDIRNATLSSHPDNNITALALNDLSLATLVKEVSLKQAGSGSSSAASLQTRVLTSLVLQTLGDKNPAPQLVSTTLDDVSSALRVQGRTAYIAEASGASASAASLDDQALALLLLLRSGATHQLLPKLAAYIASPPAVGGYGIFSVSYSLRDQGLAVAALSEYDRARGSSKPDLNITASVDGLDLLQASFTANSTAPVNVNTTTPWAQLESSKITMNTNTTLAVAGNSSSSSSSSRSNNTESSSPRHLNFRVTGSGEVTVAASLHFVPAELLSYPTYRGLYVEAALQLVDPATGGPTGLRVSAVPLASVVVLTVQVTSPDDVGPVTLSVMMPAGLEPLDPNLDTSSSGGGGRSTAYTCTAGQLQDVQWSIFWPLPICPAQETRPSVVTFSYLALRAGTSTVAFRAVAATAGTFVLPPVKAEADNQPELMGMTAASTLVVCADCDKPTFIPKSPFLPKSCPNKGCKPRGVCNLSTGKCVCTNGNGNGNGNVSQC